MGLVVSLSMRPIALKTKRKAVFRCVCDAVNEDCHTTTQRVSLSATVLADKRRCEALLHPMTSPLPLLLRHSLHLPGDLSPGATRPIISSRSPAHMGIHTCDTRDTIAQHRDGRGQAGILARGSKGSFPSRSYNRVPKMFFGTYRVPFVFQY